MFDCKQITKKLREHMYFQKKNDNACTYKGLLDEMVIFAVDIFNFLKAY